MGTKAAPGKHDCYDKAEKDEPLFVLLARDPIAPILVDLWAQLAAVAGQDEEKINEAFRCAIEMRRYRASKI